MCRSRKGAWIEILICFVPANTIVVAPARERGLKFTIQQLCSMAILRRSRKGAWIEMRRNFRNHAVPRVAPARERGLKSLRWSVFGHMVTVAPARERGLK